MMSRSSMRGFVVVAIAALFPSPCLAQSYFLWSGSLRDDEAYAAWISEARVDLRWGGERQIVVFEDEALRVEGEIPLGDRPGPGPESRLAVGIGEEVALRARGGWRIRMLPETWAPVMGARSGAVRIALPARTPVRRAWLPVPAAPAASDPADEPWSWDAAALDERKRRDAETGAKTDACFEDDLRPREGSRIRWRPHWLGGETIRRLFSRGASALVRGYVDGFAVEGFRKRKRCGDPFSGDEGLGNDPVHSVAGDGCDPGGRRIWLEPGTDLYATPSSAAPFARIKQRIEALERTPDEGLVSCIRCASRGGTPSWDSGADPAQPSRTPIEVEHANGRARVRLRGYLRVVHSSWVDAAPGEIVPCHMVGSYDSYSAP